VFLNLLNNAIDALSSGPGLVFPASTTPTIWIATELVNPELVAIRVKDNGIGIPDGMRSRLFDPFFTTKPVGEGMGLGLSTSYQIVVDRHKGRLTYQSSEGQGAEFTVEIPIRLSSRTN
jgi:signal transduction histidine kinase